MNGLNGFHRANRDDDGECWIVPKEAPAWEIASAPDWDAPRRAVLCLAGAEGELETLKAGEPKGRQGAVGGRTVQLWLSPGGGGR